MTTTKTATKAAAKKVYNLKPELESPNETCFRIFGIGAREAAKDMGFDLATLYQWINRGELFVIEPETKTAAVA
jgi:hypothetical protein